MYFSESAIVNRGSDTFSFEKTNQIAVTETAHIATMETDIKRNCQKTGHTSFESLLFK